MSEPMTSVPVPAAMPSEEDVARYRSMVDRVNRMTDDGRLPGEPKRAPSAIDSPHNACCYREQCKALEARALAAEAALAGERERCLAIVEAQVPDWVKERFGPYWDGYREAMEDATNDIRKGVAAAIRAQGE